MITSGPEEGLIVLKLRPHCSCCTVKQMKTIFVNSRSAYHLNGIFGNSGANSNGMVHPIGKFLEKRQIFRGISFFSA